MIKDLINLLSNSKIEYSLSESLKLHSTFKIGGDAAVFTKPADFEQLKSVLLCAKENGIRFFILGKGSNLLFDDVGFDGVVISTEKLNSYSVNGNEITFDVGYSFTQAAIVAKDNNLSGLEFAYGIPGSVGGAVFMNAGAYGGEVSQVLKSSKYYDLDCNEFFELDLKDHNFGYRTSYYKENRNCIIVSSTFVLENSSKESVKETMDDYLNRRKNKQPLDYPSAGSVFKRPEGHFAGQLIEELGLKGYTIGGAQISSKHAGFIINVNSASSNDVIKLVKYIQDKVKDAYDVNLECEIVVVK